MFRFRKKNKKMKKRSSTKVVTLLIEIDTEEVKPTIMDKYGLQNRRMSGITNLNCLSRTLRILVQGSTSKIL